MHITGISWLGIGTDDFDDSLHFFTDILGLKKVAGAGEVAMLAAGEGQIVELFGPGSRGRALTKPPVVAFEVADVGAARDELIAAGVEIVGEIGAWNGFEWLYFRGPERQLYAVKKTPPPGWEATA